MPLIAMVKGFGPVFALPGLELRNWMGATHPYVIILRPTAWVPSANSVSLAGSNSAKHRAVSELCKSHCASVFQSPTLLLPMTLVCSPTSFSVRMRWNMIVGKLSILAWPGFAKTTLGGDFCWRTHGRHLWKPGWTAPALEKFPSITMNCKAPSIFLSKTWSMESSPLMCELWYFQSCLGHTFPPQYNETDIFSCLTINSSQSLLKDPLKAKYPLELWERSMNYKIEGRKDITGDCHITFLMFAGMISRNLHWDDFGLVYVKTLKTESEEKR